MVLVLAIPESATLDDIESIRVSGGEEGTVTIPRSAFGTADGNPFIDLAPPGRGKGRGLQRQLLYAPRGDAIYAFYHVGSLAGRPDGASVGGTRELQVVPIAGDGADVRIHFDVFDCGSGDLSAGHGTTWLQPGCRVRLECPEPASLECVDGAAAGVVVDPVWNSTCDAPVEITSTEAVTYDYRGPGVSTYTVDYRAATPTHEASCRTTRTVADTLPAVVTCIEGQSLSADDACRVTARPATAQDACEGSLSVSCSATELTGVGVHEMVCEATDRAGNVASCATTVSVFDVTSPELSCSPDQTLECSGPCATVAQVTATATDNCSTVEIVCPGGDGPFCMGDTTVTCRGVDESTNSAVCRSTVSVVDTTPPSIDCAPDVTVPTSANPGAVCAATVASGAAGADVCDPAPAVDCAPIALALDAPGATRATCTATDASGNAVACEQTLTLVDDTPPAIECPAPQTVSADASCRASVPLAPSGSDNCPGAGAAQCAPGALSFTEPGTKTADCAIADGSGNTAGCVARATMVDDTPPSITCPAPQTVECAGPCATPVVVSDPTVQDNCAVAGASCALGTGDYCLGETVDTCRGVDASGNQSECETTVTVVDTIAPTITCALDETVLTSANQGAACAAALAPSAVAAGDVCDPDPAVACEAAINLDAPGSAAAGCTVSDTSGNSASCEQTLTLVDDTPPAIECPAPQTVSADASCRATVPLAPFGSDNCPGAGAAQCAPGALSFTEPGTKTADCAIADGSGNTAGCVARATMVDDTPPSITCPAPQTVECTGPCATRVEVEAPASNDNCALAGAICDLDSGDYCLGEVAGTCSATDAAGNTSQCAITFSVVDTTPPVPSCAAPASALAGAGLVAPVPDLAVGATDTCAPEADVQVVQDPPAGTLLGRGEHTVTVTATDPSGNAAACQTTFNVRGIEVDAAPFGPVLVYEDAGLQDGDPCLSGPAPVSYPGSDDPIVVVACFTDDLQTVRSISFEVLTDVPPAGSVLLEGTYDAATDQLCLGQVTDLVFPPTQAPIDVTACLGSQGTTVDSLVFHTRTTVEPLGEVSLEGSYDAAADRLCFGGLSVTGELAGFSHAVNVTACLVEQGTIFEGVTFDATLVTPLGAAAGTGSYDAATGEVCLDADLEATLLGVGLAVDARTCLALVDGSPQLRSATLAIDVELPPLGRATLRGSYGGDGPDCLTGRLDGDLGWLPIPVVSQQGLWAQVCLVDGQVGPVRVSTDLTIGGGPAALTLVGEGVYRGASDFDFTLALPQGAQWAPFSGVVGAPPVLAGLAFTELGGRLANTGEGPSLTVTATLAEDLELFPGIVLEKAQAKGRLGSAAGQLAFQISLAGDLAIPLGFDDLLLHLEGRVDGTRLSLLGTATTRNGGLRLEPFRDTLGDGALVVGLENAAAVLSLDFVARSAFAELSANTSFGLLGANAELGTTVTASLGTGGWGLTLVGALQALDVPVGDDVLHLGDGGHVLVVASTIALQDHAIDLDGDPANGSEHTFDVSRGLSLIAVADLTFLDDYFPEPRATLELNFAGPTAYRLKGTLELPFDIIRPEHQVPGLHSAGFERVDFNVDINDAAVEVALGGALSLVPLDADGGVQQPLTAAARFKFAASIDSPYPKLGGEATIEGLWRDPFLLRGFAVMNPGVAITLGFKQVAQYVVPYPHELGFNNQMFFRRHGEWPETIELDAQGNVVDLPDNLATVGGTFYYNLATSTSGVCPFGLCIPLPTLIARFDFQRIGNEELAAVLNAFRDIYLAFASIPGLESLADQVSDQPIDGTLDLPAQVELRQASFGLSTHDVRKFGVDFSAGISLALDLDVSVLGVVHDLQLHGFLDGTGALLAGHMDPLRIIPGIEVVGDPYRREVVLGGGFVRVPDRDALDAPATLEAWVRTDGPGVVMSKHDGDDGYHLAVGPAAPTACERAEEDPPCPDALTLTARVLRGGAVRELTSKWGVIRPGARQHVALTLQPGDGTATLRVDGVAAPLDDSAAGLLPGPSAADLTMGAGLIAIDDMRVWARVRTAAEISGESTVLPSAFRHDPDLLGRYEADYDTGPVAHDSAGGRVHAAYTGGAASVAVVDDQDLFFKLSLDLGDLGQSGFGFAGGASLDWDPPIPGLERRFSAQATLDKDSANTRLYVRQLPLLWLPDVGVIELSGNGPNAVAGDFDDGLYFEADLRATPAPTVNASARVTFLHPDGSRHEAGSGSFLLDCLDPAGCAEVSEYTFETAGELDLDLPLRDGAVVHVEGRHSYSSETRVFHVDGQLSAYGHVLNARDITIGPEHATLTADMRLGAIGSLDLGVASSLHLELDYDPGRLCGEGATDLRLDGLGTFEGEIAACVGQNPHLSFRGTGSANLAGLALVEVDLEVSTERGVFIERASVDIPGVFVGTVSGHYVSPEDFELTGTSVVSAVQGLALHTALTVTPAGVHAVVRLNPGCGDCAIVATLGGVLDFSGPAVAYDLSAEATVRLGLFSLQNGRARLSSADGLVASGRLDLGLGPVDFTGRYDLQTGAFELTGALERELFGGAGSLSATATIDAAGATLDGTLRLWDASGHLRGLIGADAGGGAGDYVIDTTLQLVVPTAAQGYALSNGNVRLTHSNGVLRTTISGDFSASGLSASITGTVNGDDVELSGQARLGDAAAPVATGTFRIDNTGATATFGWDPPGLPAATLRGRVRTDAQGTTIDGALAVGGFEFLSGSIRVAPGGLTLTGALAIVVFGHDFGDVTLELDVRYAPAQVCGTGSVPFPLDGTRTCSVEACLGEDAAGGVTVTVPTVACDLGLCFADAMCGDGRFCDLLGQCWDKRPNDQGCAADHECRSGFCDIWQGFTCQDPLPDGTGCVQDGQCASGRCGFQQERLSKQCYTPGAVDLGDLCYDDLHCARGNCWGSATWPAHCLCETDAECANSPKYGAGYVCKTGTWGITPESGTCILPRQAGEACDADSECTTGACADGRCACTAHAQCGDGNFCNAGGCEAKRASNNNQYCESGDWCQSGQCAYSVKWKRDNCFTYADFEPGHWCDLHQNCASGTCSQNFWGLWACE